MSKDFWQKIEEIFPLVADLPASERERRLLELCAGDENLRREISALLAADEKAADFCEAPVQMPNSLSSTFLHRRADKTRTLDLAGQNFGAYRVVRKIGAGGMGAVYLAVRADGEFDKEVAVKIVKNGADTELNLRRFRRERQILARLEHPNIARLIDGGTTDDGAPYFVMERVEGKPLLDYCRVRELNLSDRLQLFRQVCAAVAYAHEAGVIHRDLKPGNILVTQNGVIKLLDFGIAKIFRTSALGYESNVQTATLMRQMTPEYASPEQIKGEIVTPATDIYSLGIILYELLTGERPYKFPSRAPHEIARVICEEPVQIPNSKEYNPVSDKLSYVVLKALQKKPSERYASVRDFDQDIEKILADSPIVRENSESVFFEKPASDEFSACVSLAVVPFQIIAAGNGEIAGSDSNEDFFGVGLADALTTKLFGVRQLAVRPTSSVVRLAAKNKNALALGKELNVDYVLEGHILHIGEQIRVSVQLLKTRDDSVLWAKHFDESDGDIFRLQDSISERVATALVPRLTSEEQALLRHHGTTNAEAFEAYFRGRVSYHSYTFDGIVASENYFKQAIAHDPNFALAHSGLADFYNWLSVVGLVSPIEGSALAKKSAQRAIELDSNLSEAYASLAFAIWAYDWDFSKAERLFQKSIALNPNYIEAHEWYAYLLSSMARHDEALTEMRRAEQLDPNSPSVAAMYGFCFFNARLYAEGLKKERRSLELDPDYYLALQGLGWVCPPLGLYDEAIAGARRAVEVSGKLGINKFSLALALIAAGQIEEARKIAAELEELCRTKNVPPYYPAVIYANLNEPETAFRWLDRAIEARGYWTLWMRVEPRLDCLREDRRFVERLEKIKPLQNSRTTTEFVSPRTDKFQQRGKFKICASITAAAVLICVAVIGAANFKILVLNKANLPDKIVFAKKDDSPNKTPFAAAPTNERAKSEKPRTTDAVADGLYLAGKQQMEARTPEAINKAIEFFSEAVSRDPSFALAFTGLADAHLLMGGGQPNLSADYYQKSEDYAVKALALDPDLAQARVSLGMAKFRNSGDFASAEKHFLRAIELDQSLARAHHWYSVILWDTGKFDDALREIKIAAELEPGSAVIQLSVGELYVIAKRYDRADFYFDKTIEIDRGFVAAYHWKSILQQFRGEYEAALETYRKARIYKGNDEKEPLWLLMQASVHAAKGRRGEALAILKRFLPGGECSKESAFLAADIALVYNLLGDDENTFAWLEKVKIHNAGNAKLISTDLRFANLHHDPRFARLVEKWQSRLRQK
jgi:serine/threonine protein kinase/tetratricopeptide (TPR) repeat protein